ncbi:MAG: hypothetical protein HYV68_02910 [Candidatus Taylorbacteria bacterium]|nr:hypothetical protein [Candidatus Taylorbacteria bacterium]
MSEQELLDEYVKHERNKKCPSYFSICRHVVRQTILRLMEAGKFAENNTATLPFEQTVSRDTANWPYYRTRQFDRFAFFMKK